MNELSQALWLQHCKRLPTSKDDGLDLFLAHSHKIPPVDRMTMMDTLFATIGYDDSAIIAAIADYNKCHEFRIDGVDFINHLQGL